MHPRAASVSSLRVGDTRSGAPRGRGYSDSPLIKIMLQKAPTQSLFITGYLVSRLRVLVNSVGRPRVIPAPRLRPFIPMELLRRLACFAGGHGGAPPSPRQFPASSSDTSRTSKPLETQRFSPDVVMTCSTCLSLEDSDLVTPEVSDSIREMTCSTCSTCLQGLSGESVGTFFRITLRLALVTVIPIRRSEAAARSSAGESF